MASAEYLVTYGAAGHLGRFQPALALDCQRGDRVLLRTRRGLEIGVILGASACGYGDAFDELPEGDVLRLATDADEQESRLTAAEPADIFDLTRQLASDLRLPVDIIDTETLGDPRTLIVHYLGMDEFDPRPFVSALARQFDCYVELLDLTAPHAKNGTHGPCSTCGREEGGCGEGAGGGCGSCGSAGGGCGSGCSAANGATFEKDWQAHFAELRAKMEQRFPLTTV
jgi:cell fate regulator YaaT (PSP1 superfamily)